MYRRRAFTLIELIVALAIVALLAALAIPVYSTVQTQANQKAASAQANTLAQAVGAFYAVNGCYPDSTSTSPSIPTGLSAYVGSSSWPSNQYYAANNQTGSQVPGPGGTAYYISVDWWNTSTSAWVPVYLVYNVAVPVC